MRKKDLNTLKEQYIGQTFNKLTVLDVYYDSDNKKWMVLCKCECGEQCTKSLDKVIRNHTKTCGGKIHQLEQGKLHSEWLRANNYTKDKCAVKIKKQKRLSATYKELLPILHPDFHNKLLSGELKSKDTILTKCPSCGNYAPHSFHNVYNIEKDCFKFGHPTICETCANTLKMSNYEQAIADYISNFYSGELIKNDRSVLNGKELDLYYPEKHIAIEFNGNYWHDENHRQKDYHYNKFIECYNKSITLVSIFEYEWNLHESEIKEYLIDLFNGKENKLSYKDELTINLNYPPPNLNLTEYISFIDNNYTINNNVTYTCGYATKHSASRTENTAVENTHKVKRHRRSIDELKQEYIGKTFGWLTIVDIVSHGRKLKCICTCKCGNSVEKGLHRVISGHTSSCGCFKFSKEYSEKLKSTWSTKQDVIKERSKNYSKWCKDNPDRVRQQAEHRKQTYANDPTIMQRQIASRKKTFEEHPEIQQNINRILKEYWSDSDKVEEFSNTLKQYYKEHPEKCTAISERVSAYYSENPEKKLEQSLKIKEFRKNNPDKVQQQIDARNKWLDSNRLSVIQQGIKQSAIFENNRKEIINNSNTDDFNMLLNIIHPSQMDALLAGNIKINDSILTKCSICGNYALHLFGNVWRLNASRFRTGYPPLCSACRNSLTSSRNENEIKEYISTFYNGECLLNSRDIISPFELDIYYPEKKIAIEFNGNYWHSDEFKDENYHFNKFKMCYDLGITLVSIFEFDWNSRQNEIKDYLYNLFNDRHSDISYSDNAINLNYPTKDLKLERYSIAPSCYTSNNIKIYMCGYAIPLQ